MADPYVDDKAKWHSEGDFPQELDPDQGFVHTGMFVGWLIEHSMISEDLLPEAARCCSGELTGTDVYMLWDDVPVDGMLTEEGNTFARAYFDLGHRGYMADYGEVLASGLPSSCHVRDTRENYARIKTCIDERYADWQRSIRA